MCKNLSAIRGWYSPIRRKEIHDKGSYKTAICSESLPYFPDNKSLRTINCTSKKKKHYEEEKNVDKLLEYKSHQRPLVIAFVNIIKL